MKNNKKLVNYIMFICFSLCYLLMMGAIALTFQDLGLSDKSYKLICVCYVLCLIIKVFVNVQEES